MPEREVRYCTTEDGVRIAYCVDGEGPPLVLTPFLVESFGLEHLVPEYEEFSRRLKEVVTLVRYDMRGVGLSQPDIEDVSLKALTRDLEAVVGATGLKRFTLLSRGRYGPVGIRYAAKHQGQVQALILYCTYSRGRDVIREEAGRSLGQLARADWSLGSRAIADLSSRREFGEAGLAFARWYRESTSGETCARLFESWMEVDVSKDLAEIACPALVVHPRDDPAWRLALGQQLAASIPGARLVSVAGGFHAAAFVHARDTVKIIHDFIVETVRPKKHPKAAKQASSFRSVLFTDIVGHTEMMQRLGDEQGRAVLREHERITREVLRDHSGTEVKTMGDGFMASFGSVTRAVECAVALQKAFAAWNVQGEHAGSPLQIRVGLNAGEPIAEEGDLFGATVILASRIADQAGAGEILVPDPVRHLLAGKEFLFSDRGDVVLKGFEDPVRLYEVRWREEA
jgi:class 3 adenylate cyclase/pimeloyl-ACP methyl ester carboxylesterase